MVVLLEAIKKEAKETMMFYRGAIQDLEREEYEKVDEIIEKGLKEIDMGHEYNYFGIYCTFLEIVPSKKIFRIKIDERIKDLTYSEIFNLEER